MPYVYSIYYYKDWTYQPASVRLYASCSTLKKALDLTKLKFHRFGNNINNTVRCVDLDNTAQYVIWINKVKLNSAIPDKGLTCSQPHSSIHFIEKL